jgi:hypothetical protein
MKMKIKKTNGKTASKQIHLIADVVMETSVNNSWSLNDSSKKEILINAQGTPWDKNELEEICEECLNNALSVYLALKTWQSGYYVNLNVDFYSLQEYFQKWWFREEI